MKKIKLLGILVLWLFSVINLSAKDPLAANLEEKDFSYYYNMKTGSCEYKYAYEREAFYFVTGSIWVPVTEPLVVPDGKITILKSTMNPDIEPMIFATTFELCKAARNMGTR